jgi:hypothetical protein
MLTVNEFKIYAAEKLNRDLRNSVKYVNIMDCLNSIYLCKSVSNIKLHTIYGNTKPVSSKLKLEHDIVINLLDDSTENIGTSESNRKRKAARIIQSTHSDLVAIDGITSDLQSFEVYKTLFKALFLSEEDVKTFSDETYLYLKCIVEYICAIMILWCATNDECTKLMRVLILMPTEGIARNVIKHYINSDSVDVRD